MAVNTEKLTIPAGLDREGIRRYVIERFLNEKPGTGKGDLVAKYNYEVEDCTGGHIVISRPANLNKGMDFTVHVSGVKFRPKYAFKDRPKHDDIISDLKAKKAKNPEMYKRVASLLTKIYLCQEVTSQELREINIDAGVLTCEQACLATKWLFIEQDVTYWNWSGRAMLYNSLIKHELVQPLSNV